jgi:hypothetical protein
MASFKEVIKSYKKSVGGELPLVLSKSFVFKVSIFEFGANINSALEFGRGCFGAFV